MTNTKIFKISIYYLLPYIALVLIHILLGLKMHQPHMFADELGYLGNARYLSGFAHMPNLHNTPFYNFGYSLFLVPAFWIFSDPISAFKGVIITNAFLISSLFFAIFYTLHRLFESPKKIISLISFVSCLYPAFILQSNMAWSENAFIPLYAFFIASFGILLRKKSYSATILFGVITCFLYTTHPRALLILPIAVLYLCTLAWSKELPWKQVLLSIFIIIAGCFITMIVKDHLLDLGWAGDNRYRSVPRRINGIFSTPVINPILAVSGQFLYLLLATYGLFFVGLVYIYKYVIKKASKASWQVLHDNKFNILVLLLLTSFGVFLTSSANTLGCSRSDYLIYGRINEGFLALYIGLALISLYSERFSSRINWKRPFFTGLVIILLALIVVVGRGDEMLSKPATPVNVLGIFPLINILGMPNLIIISLILIVLSIVIFYAFKFRFVLGIYLLSIFFVFVTIYGYRFYFIPTMNFMKRISSLAPHVNSIDDINILSYDRSFYNPGRWFSYQYLMPGFVFEKFSSKKNQQPKSDIVISGKGWQDSEKLGAMFLYSENHVDQALWAMPGKIRDRFLRELDYFNINLGAESAPMVWESGFHGQEWWNSIPLRWTNGAAKLIVPLDRNKLPKALRIILGATGPNGSRLLVLVNNQSLFDEEIPAGSWHKIFSLTDISLGKQLIIELLSDTFVPKEIMEGSLDSRTLGVSVRSIKLLEKGKTDQLDPAL